MFKNTRPRSEIAITTVIGVVGASSFVLVCYLGAIVVAGVIFQ